ncbi:MAG: sigma-54-dependent Fis family transcriptional regulator [Firmicutes bacterium]|nr:sigma-54-dependent Fis family transcriptional regulator [Bacillota bacterium]
MAWLLGQILAEEYQLCTAASGEEALARLREDHPDLALVDLRLGQEDGLALLPELHRIDPGLPVIVLTAYASVKTAVQAMKAGAFDYVPKPFDPDELKLTLDRALSHARLYRRVEELERELRRRYGQADLVAVSPQMLRVLAVAEKVASSDAPVLIMGESGTGKEVVARAIHALSPRHAGPFVAVNCAALPESLLESELFGYEAGAFTGARSRKPGRFENAHGGTLLLDEVADMPLSLQAKILRVLEEGQVFPLGARRPCPVDVRVLSCTNRDLPAEVQRGAFREDLYFRLAVIPLRIPPLRERREDIPLLAQHFVKFFNEKYGKQVQISPEGLQALQSYHWPGNVRELRNLVEHTVILTEKRVLGPWDFPPHITRPSQLPTEGQPPAHARGHDPAGAVAASHPGTSKQWAGQLQSSCPAPPPSGDLPLKQARLQAEWWAIREALRVTGGNRTQAARLLGISRRALLQKLKKMPGLSGTS